MAAMVFLSFMVLMFLGVPVASTLAVATFLPQFVDPDFLGNTKVILRAVIAGLDSTSILAVPLFMLSGAVTILAPILLEIAVGFGISPIHLGVVLIVNLALGMISPPIGISLFVAAPIVKTTSGELGKKIIIPMLFFIAALLLITFIPGISLALL